MGNNKKVNLYRDTASIYDLDQRSITQDVENQIIYPELIYYVTNQDGVEEKIIEPLALKYYYEEQVRNLLQSNGFKIAEEMGYYDRRPISEGPELIFICKKE